MATPKCPKCDNSSFVLEELKVDKSSYQLWGICCSLCGTVIGTHERYNIGTLLFNMAKALKINIGN
ncbi:MAG: hypothetical protein WCG82_08375 [Bacteroidota bacterium]